MKTSDGYKTYKFYVKKKRENFDIGKVLFPKLPKHNITSKELVAYSIAFRVSFFQKAPVFHLRAITSFLIQKASLKPKNFNSLPMIVFVCFELNELLNI